MAESDRWRFLRVPAAGLLVVYVAWNVAWLVQAKIPPSLFTAVTGLPCPTTGGTRSFMALCAGDWTAALRWNPMTLPILAMLGISLALLISSRLRRGRLRLPEWSFHAWCAVLATAWVVQLVFFGASS